MAVCVEMVGIAIQMGTAICGCHFFCPDKFSLGRGGKEVARGHGLCRLYRHRNGRNCSHRNGVLSRKHEYWSRVLVSYDRNRVNWSEGVHRHCRVIIRCRPDAGGRDAARIALIHINVTDCVVPRLHKNLQRDPRCKIQTSYGSWRRGTGNLRNGPAIRRSGTLDCAQPPDSKPRPIEPSPKSLRRQKGISGERAMSDERERNIRERAYAIWEKEGRPDGKSVDYWLQAEAEIGTEKIIGVTNNGKILRSSGGGVASVTPSRLRFR